MEPNKTKSLLLFFKQKWEERYNVPFQIVWGRDGAIIKRLSSTYSEDQLRSYIEFYLSDYRNDYCVRASLPIRLFGSSVNEIAGAVAAREVARERSSQLSDFDRIEQVRKEKKL